MGLAQKWSTNRQKIPIGPNHQWIGIPLPKGFTDPAPKGQDQILREYAYIRNIMKGPSLGGTPNLDRWPAATQYAITQYKQDPFSNTKRDTILITITKAPPRFHFMRDNEQIIGTRMRVHPNNDQHL